MLLVSSTALRNQVANREFSNNLLTSSESLIAGEQSRSEMPIEEKQRTHALTHLPYAPWCDSCVSHRVRANLHLRDNLFRDGGTATVSFDFCHTKAGEDGRQVRDVDAVCAVVVIDSATGFLAAIPVSKKSQFDMMVRELLSFVQISIRARQSLGLATKASSPPAYSRGNLLCENAVQRIEDLACSSMRNLQKKLGVTLPSTHGIWT